MNPEFDEHDAEILRARLEAWNQRKGPRVGDFCIMPDGELRRFTHDWGDGLQTTWKGHDYDSSFYFGKGFMSFSGSLDRTIPNERIEDTGTKQKGRAWFFHHDQPGAHRGVYFWAECRVYRINTERGASP